MHEKTRTRIAWILLMVLSPILALTVWDLASKIEERRTRRGGTQASPASSPPAILRVPTPDTGTTRPADAWAPPDTRVLEEQRKVAAANPSRNPFSARPPVRTADTGVPRPAVRRAPNFILNGFVFRRDTERRLAVINGQLVGEGDACDGWTVQRIQENSVVLVSGSQRLVVQKP